MVENEVHCREQEGEDPDGATNKSGEIWRMMAVMPEWEEDSHTPIQADGRHQKLASRIDEGKELQKQEEKEKQSNLGVKILESRPIKGEHPDEATNKSGKIWQMMAAMPEWEEDSHTPVQADGHQRKLGSRIGERKELKKEEKKIWTT
ncbi:hypothetical protein NXF25_007762 [Crotalus adamanteus]|uniref:Uncharacterized protein n=1 Tax=Crotalus adamanteus TaxID=8729 RepID=A0AAW1BLA8_CROAD